MPRRKQDNPQHLEGDEMEPCVENGEKSTHEDLLNGKAEHSGPSDAEAEISLKVSSPKCNQQHNLTAPAIISAAEWMNVKATLQALQQQQQLIHLQLLQHMQLMSSLKNTANVFSEAQAQSAITSDCDSNDNPSSAACCLVKESTELRNGRFVYENPTTSPIDEINPRNLSVGDRSNIEFTNPLELKQNSPTAVHRTDNRPSFGGTAASSPVFHDNSRKMVNPTIIQDRDPVESVEDYMEIQKSENQLEHLVKNIDRAVTDPNQCLICKRILSCKSALQMHYRTHTGERPFKCKLCCRAFTTKGNLKTHMGVHRAKPPLRLLHTCPVCNKQFTNALVLNQHVRLHTDQNKAEQLQTDAPCVKRPCDPEEPELNDATKVAYPSGSSEVIRGHPSVSSEVAHSADSPDNQAEERRDLGLLSMPSVSTGFPFMFSAVPMQEHMRYAEALTRQWEQLHQFSMFSPIAASGLFSSGLGFSAMLPQMSLQQQLVSGPTDFSIKTNTRHSDEEGRGISMTQDPREYRLDSDLAGRPASPSTQASPGGSSAPSYTDFSKTNGASQPPMSPQSEQSSNSDATHRTEPPPGTACDVCMKSFACRSALEIHYRSHTKERPFKCDFCEKAFTTRGNLKQHILTHKADDINWKLTNISPTPSVTSQAVVSGSGSTPSSQDDSFLRRSGTRHQCSVCSKNFSSASALQIHFRTHTGDRPFKCNVCGKAFTTKGNLKVHMGTHMWNATPSRRGRRLSVDEPESKISHAQSNGMVQTANNNVIAWNNINTAAFMKASLLNGQAAMLAGYPSMLRAGGSPNNGKPRLWQMSCHICNKDYQSPTDLEHHMKSHIISEGASTQSVTAP